ncbi:MAG: response regulator [Candidatus Aminicenantes bacterium]|nr:response regulator [Candidatus Aminicenantes bacterium]
MAINIKRKAIRFTPDPKRVITRFFKPGDLERSRSLINKVLQMSSEDRQKVFNQILRNFSNRHRNITRIFENNFENVKENVRELGIDPDTLDKEKKLIIGSYFTMEFSIEATAFFNPSIVEDPYQGDLLPGQKRIIVSFRATGEGHISSLVFRSGIIDQHNNLTFKPARGLVDVPEIITRYIYEKRVFLNKLKEMKIKKDVINLVMNQLGDQFRYGELQAAIKNVLQKEDLSITSKKVVKAIEWLASSHYEVIFSLDTAISERVLFPISYSESNGIEDARFVRFTDEDGSIIYYATYTAYDGYSILPKLCETKDFYHFKVVPLHGEHAQHKGMALFPRKINGKYAMLSRLDGMNNFVMFSDNINLWLKAKKIQEPIYPWELVQIGNAGSPIETEHGWLVITHGVGPMRTYCLGATLLDLDNPTKIIGRLKEPLLIANEEEREGYVPNVVYSCGSLPHNGELIIPYGMSDYATSFASVSLDELIHQLLPSSNDRGEAKKNTFSILLVEDDAKDQKSISKILAEGGYAFKVASDGIDALMQIAQGKFDLVLSDIQMPNFDGFQLLEQMNQKQIHIPVIFITDNHYENYDMKSQEMGAAAYIEKPIQSKRLLQILGKILNKN